jgi:hypothetical protein
MTAFGHRYELRCAEELIATGHLTREEPFELGETIVIGGSVGMVSALEPLVGEHETRPLDPFQSVSKTVSAAAGNGSCQAGGRHRTAGRRTGGSGWQLRPLIGVSRWRRATDATRLKGAVEPAPTSSVSGRCRDIGVKIHAS